MSAAAKRRIGAAQKARLGEVPNTTPTLILEPSHQSHFATPPWWEHVPPLWVPQTQNLQMKTGSNTSTTPSQKGSKPAAQPHSKAATHATRSAPKS